MNLEPFCLDDSQDSRGTAAFHLIQEIVLSSNMFIPGSLQQSPIFFFFFYLWEQLKVIRILFLKKTKKKTDYIFFYVNLNSPFVP